MKKNFEARTEQEAVELAVREFGVNEDFLEVEVLQRTKGGLFGRNGKIVISATVVGLPSSDESVADDHSHATHSRNTQHVKPMYSDDEIKQEASEEHQEKICEIVKNLVLNIGIEADCSFNLEDNYYVISIDTLHNEDQNILIGKHGRTLEAIQNISNSIIHNKMRDFKHHIVVDVEGYRKKRNEWLISIAKRKAEQVLDTGNSYLFDELDPFDRKLIHGVIRECEGVSTISKGNGHHKRIQIYLE